MSWDTRSLSSKALAAEAQEEDGVGVAAASTALATAVAKVELVDEVARGKAVPSASAEVVD